MRQACPCLWRPIQPATRLQLGSRPALASFKLSLGLGTDGASTVDYASHAQGPWSCYALLGRTDASETRWSADLMSILDIIFMAESE